MLNRPTRAPGHACKNVIARRSLLRAGAAAALLPAPALAQAWPAKPIRIICGYPAGGLTDIFARAYGEHISRSTGQTCRLLLLRR